MLYTLFFLALSQASNKEVVQKYYDAYNAGDVAAQTKLMDASVLHEPNQGKATTGVDKYREFAERSYKHYREKCLDLQFFESANGNVAVESRVVGNYIKSEPGDPPAKNQKYELQVVEVFAFKNGKISRLSTHYNEKSWEDQIAKQ